MTSPGALSVNQWLWRISGGVREKILRQVGRVYGMTESERGIPDAGSPG